MPFDPGLYEAELQLARDRLNLSFIEFDPKKHPRDMKGRFREVAAAADRWFDYGHVRAVKAASAGDPLTRSMDDGSVFTPEQATRHTADAEALQEAASRSKSAHKALYRGLVHVGDLASASEKYRRGAVVEFDALTAASPDRDVASIYHDIENMGYDPGEATPVRMDLYDKNRITGLDRDERGETLLPRGSRWRVRRSFVDKDGTLRVEMSPVRDDGYVEKVA